MQTGKNEATLDRDRLREATLEDESLMQEILAVLVDDTSRQLVLLDRAIREQNSQQCARLAHYSKGACANVGADRAASLFQRLEHDATAKAFEDCGVALRELNREVDQLRAEIVSAS